VGGLVDAYTEKYVCMHTYMQFCTHVRTPTNIKISLQHIATTLRHIATKPQQHSKSGHAKAYSPPIQCNTLQNTATTSQQHCNYTWQPKEWSCQCLLVAHTMPHTATHCNNIATPLQLHLATNRVVMPKPTRRPYNTTHCNTLQQHCNNTATTPGNQKSGHAKAHSPAMLI